ncbi:MAG TPA: SET domain-containing protein-lysine N-methyltransferase [Flavobacteriales bacterium]|nr:SET domain-containing protein-lysine N-methyltransferase [Flavobacteriales bacterium]
MAKTLKIAKRRSKIHGSGVVATAPIRKGEHIVEYKGKIVTHAEADRDHRGDLGTGHTFLFTLNEDWIINANIRGNIAKWINCSCDPNAEAFVHEHKGKNRDPRKDKVIIEARRAIKPGDEITYDYGFEFDVPYTKELLKTWACHCSSPKCRGTMLNGKKLRAFVKANPDWNK